MSHTPIVQFPCHTDTRGDLYVCECLEHVPFEIKRIFWVSNPHQRRGGHSHNACWQCIIATSGSMRVALNSTQFRLTTPAFGLLVPPETVVSLDQFSDDCTFVVLCSEHYDAEDVVVPEEPIDAPSDRVTR